MKLTDRLFSISIEPASSENRKDRLTISYFKTGQFYVIQSDPKSLNAEQKIDLGLWMKSFALLDMIKGLKEAFAHAPKDTRVMNDSFNQFIVAFGEDTHIGSLVMGNEALMNALPEEEKKKQHWNDKIVHFFTQQMQTLQREEEMSERIGDSVYAHMIKPEALLFLQNCQSFLQEEKKIKTIDEAIKKAMRDTYRSKVIDGEDYARIFSFLRGNVGLQLKTPKSSYDDRFSQFAKELIRVAGMTSFAEAAFLLDNVFLEMLLTLNSILNEKTIALLHEPISPLELADRYGDTSEKSYFLFQDQNRFTSDSRIYAYLKELTGLDYDTFTNESDSRYLA